MSPGKVEAWSNEKHEDIIQLRQYTDQPNQSGSSIFHICQEQVISDNADIW